MHCCRQLGTSIQEDFSPPSSLGGSFREGTRTLRINRGVETGPTNSIISSLGLSGGSSEPADHARSCPSPADLLTAFLGSEGKPIRAPRVCGIAVSKGRCYPFPSSRRLFGVTLRATQGLYRGADGVAGTLNNEAYVWKPIQVSAQLGFSLQQLELVIGWDKTAVKTTSRG